ncbi:MAG TPA: hypothetical protein DCM45_02000 [Clostridiales bacterium]|nr:hypothetical protein [Clostridiales bacterium]
MNSIFSLFASIQTALTVRGSLVDRVIKVITDNPDEFLTALSQHIVNLVLIPVLLAIIIAVPLGILATRRPFLEKIFLTVVNVLQTIPSLALLTLMIVIGLGIGTRPAIIALFLYSLLPILRNTVVGIKSVDPFLKEAALGMGMTGWQRLHMIELPLAFQVIMGGIRTAAVICIGTGTIAAYIGAGGLGQFIVRGLNLYRDELLLVGAIPSALLALLTDYLLGRFEYVMTPRGLRISKNQNKSTKQAV